MSATKNKPLPSYIGRGKMGKLRENINLMESLQGAYFRFVVLCTKFLDNLSPLWLSFIPCESMI